MHAIIFVCAKSCSYWPYNFLYLLIFFNLINIVNGTGGGFYIAEYQNYPTGVSFIEIVGLQGGSRAPNTKWNAECGDAQALTGIRDVGYDFVQIITLKCKTMFPKKPPTRGFYPYFERCQVRNISETVDEFFCFDPKIDDNSVDMFAVAMWEDDVEFHLNDLYFNKPYVGTAIKCCGTPPGYSLGDYSGCHLRHTHDAHWEYYDSIHFVVECPDGYVISGIGVVKNPITYDRHYDWIQCCPLVYNPTPVGRLGYPPLEPALLSAEQYNDLLSFKRVTRRPTTTTGAPVTTTLVDMMNTTKINNIEHTLNSSSSFATTVMMRMVNENVTGGRGAKNEFS